MRSTPWTTIAMVRKDVGGRQRMHARGEAARRTQKKNLGAQSIAMWSMARGWRATATLLSSTRGPRRLLSTAAEKAEGGCCAIKQKQEKKQPETPFWRDAESWKRSRHNTLRCLAGCSLGDFSMLFYLQTHHPEFPGGMAGVAAAAMVSGVLTSLALETVVLSLGAMRMPLRRSASTAAKMSLASMIAMEAAENATNFALTAGVVDASSPVWWAALAPSLAAGFLVPLPYNYYMLRKYGKSCH